MTVRNLEHTMPRGPECFQAFRHIPRHKSGKAAQTRTNLIEIIGELTRSEEPHNLKVIGSNPIPATKLSVMKSNG
jgi:hypothetical protein